MRRFQSAAMFCLAACLGAAGFQAFAVPRQADRPAVERDEPKKPPVGRWQYRSVRLLNDSQLDVTANEQAEKGWEVVEVVPVVSSGGDSFTMLYTMLFRRAADAKD
jgi:hypothetical protein